MGRAHAGVALLTLALPRRVRVVPGRHVPDDARTATAAVAAATPAVAAHADALAFAVPLFALALLALAALLALGSTFFALAGALLALAGALLAFAGALLALAGTLLALAGTLLALSGALLALGCALALAGGGRGRCRCRPCSKLLRLSHRSVCRLGRGCRRRYSGSGLRFRRLRLIARSRSIGSLLLCRRLRHADLHLAGGVPDHLRSHRMAVDDLAVDREQPIANAKAHCLTDRAGSQMHDCGRAGAAAEPDAGADVGRRLIEHHEPLRPAAAATAAPTAAAPTFAHPARARSDEDGETRRTRRSKLRVAPWRQAYTRSLHVPRAGGVCDTGPAAAAQRAGPAPAIDAIDAAPVCWAHGERGAAVALALRRRRIGWMDCQ